MPTGYTAPLHDGDDISFEDFVLRCARGMAACILQRDEGLDSPPRMVKVSSYHQDRIDEAQGRLAELEAMAFGDFAKMAREAHKVAEASHLAAIAENEAMRQRYVDMIGVVTEWTPPSSEHKGLKTFMLEQLRESLDFDCHEPSPPTKLNGGAYREELVDRAHRDIEYHTKALSEEEERTHARNMWTKVLYESLGRELLPA